MTPAEIYCQEEARRMLEADEHRGAVALVIAYRKAGESPRDVHIANAIVMSNAGAALEVAMLIRRLRELADELEQTVRGERPLPKQP